MEVKPLHPVFAAELVGADLTGAPDAELVATVEEAMARYGVLAIREAEISDEQQKNFSRAFGPLEIPSRAKDAPARPQGTRQFDPLIFYAGNLDHNGEIIPYASEAGKLAKGAERFHTDSSFHTLPTKWSLLLGHIIPPVGGDTHFIDTRAVYDRLSPDLKAKAEQLMVVHDFWRGRELTGAGGVTDEMRQAMPPVTQPLVRTMPYGRKALYIGAPTRHNSAIAADLGCAMEESPAGPVVTVDGMKMTSVPGVYAAGDITRAMHNVTFAVADGVMAGVAIHASLVF